MLGERDVKVLAHDHAANHNDTFGGIIMTNYRLAYIEHIIQLLICKIEQAQVQTGNTWRELESIRSNLNALSMTYADLLAERRLDHDR